MIILEHEGISETPSFLQDIIKYRIPGRGLWDFYLFLPLTRTRGAWICPRAATRPCEDRQSRSPWVNSPFL